MDVAKLIEALKGYKSYFVLLAMGAVGYLGVQEMVTQDTVEMGFALLTPLLGVTFSAKINRLIQSIQKSLPQ